jgi:hypothetical protein
MGHFIFVNLQCNTEFYSKGNEIHGFKGKNLLILGASGTGQGASGLLGFEGYQA